MELFPLFVDLSGRRVLVVGGGDIAERKIRLLLSAGAQVRVIAPDLCKSVRQLAHEHGVELLQQAYAAPAMDGVWFVVAATDDARINHLVARDAGDRRLFVNVVDDAELSSCQVPAIVDRAPLTIAISSAGAAPMIARSVREQIEALFDHSLGELAGLARQYRPHIKAACPGMVQRRAFYEWLLDGPVLHALQKGNQAEAKQLLCKNLVSTSRPKQGVVTLVEAGLGNPALMSLQALRALNQASLILHDPGIPVAMLDMARRDAKRMVLLDIDLESRRDHASENALAVLLDQVSQGESVVIVREGNAFSLGQAWRDIDCMTRHQVAYRIIPAMAAAQAGAAYAGIPLLGEKCASAVYTRIPPNYLQGYVSQWFGLAMGGKTLTQEITPTEIPHYAQGLIANGLSPDTACAVVLQCSFPEQVVLQGKLKTVGRQIANIDQDRRVLLFIGKQVEKISQFKWYGMNSEEYPVKNNMYPHDMGR